MDQQSLNKYFSTAREDDDQQRAFCDLRGAGRELAETINSLVPESPSKADIMGRLFRIIVDSELAIRMDGVSQTKNMIVMTQ